MKLEFIPREKAFLATCTILFVASAAGTIYLCRSMSGGMDMPGGWTMSMAWMRMPGQSWLSAAAMFLGMWIVMMVAMMLPSLLPILSGYRRSVHLAEETRAGSLTLFAGAGYFFVWAAIGIIAYELGTAITTAEMHRLALARYAPVGTAAVLLLAGAFQLTPLKLRRLARCRRVLACRLPASPSASQAWHQGITWGLDCSLCCSGFMAALLAVGVMSLPAMVLLATAITLERWVPGPERSARVAGMVIIAAGMFAFARGLRG